MNLPELKEPGRYTGLYVIDFGDHAGVGFTAEEVAELLESEKFAHIKVYKIHNAYPDGRMELKGVPAGRFQLELGMFFYAADQEQASGDYKRLTSIAVSSTPPCRAKVHLSRIGDQYLTALIYPAEYDDEVSLWLSDNNYETIGPAEGGTGAVERYYQADADILARNQLFTASARESRTGQELLANVKSAVQR